MPLQIAPLLLVASMADTASAQVDKTQGVRLEVAGAAVWKTDYDDDYGTVERRGPGVSGSATFRPGKRLALATDLAWMHTSDPYPSYSESRTDVALTGSLLWHFGNRPVQPYLGIGATLVNSNYCYSFGSAQPASCGSESDASPVLLAGVKFINYRSGLIIAPEVRFEYLSLRLGLSVGKAWFRRK